MRLTQIPHLAIEILSSDPARDLIRKSAKYAAAGLVHYWVVDPEVLEIVEYRLPDGESTYREAARHFGASQATLDIGVCRVTLVPDNLAP